MKHSKIEWCHHTGNLWWGCVLCALGCYRCFAEIIAKKLGLDIWGIDKPRLLIKSVWDDFIKYQNMAKEKGEKHFVFVGSMFDIFEKPMPLIDWNGNKTQYASTEELRQRFFREIVPNCPNLIFLLLTKRPSNINKYIPESWKTNPPSNVIFGTSVSEQASFNNNVRLLRRVNGKRFLSVEPQLDKIDLGNLEGIDWIIQGGESGDDKRPFDLAWARQMRDECARLNIPYFFKQIDKVQAIPADLQIRQYPVMEIAGVDG